tara:strand:- start:136 stop:441 length:306 start_codon:yes stop_codon:yes gene_type:complete
VFKAFDESFCSAFCRYKLVKECDYNNVCELVKKQAAPKKTNTISAEDRIAFDFSTIDIHYASYNYRHDIADVVYHNTGNTPKVPSISEYISNIFYGIVGML